MKIAVAKEIDPSEPRVAVSPDTIKKFKALGAEVAIGSMIVNYMQLKSVLGVTALIAGSFIPW